MSRFYTPLPAPEIRNAMVDLRSLDEAAGQWNQNRQQNAMMAYRQGRDAVEDKRADASMGMQQERQGWARDTHNAEKRNRANQAVAGLAQMIKDAPPDQQAAMYQKFRTTIPDFDADMAAAGYNPGDINSLDAIIARARGYQAPQKPDVREVGKSLVRISPDGMSAAPIYTPQPGAAGPDKDIAGIEESLRKEYSSHAKPYFEVRDAYTRVQQSASQPSAAGDLALIFNYMKMLDPSSVVREGEFATAQSAGSVPDRIWNVYNRILSGERLNPEQRGDFVNQARGLFQRQEQQYKAVQDQFRAISERTGVNPQNTIVDYGRPASFDQAEPKQAPDGNYYIPDPNRPGKFLRVDP